MKQFEVWLVALDPTRGAEMKKTRPCVVVSPDELNEALHTVIVAPMTTSLHRFPSRVRLKFAGKTGEVALDQLRAADKKRLSKRLGALGSSDAQAVSDTLCEMFGR